MKWDGKTASTAVVAITLIELLYVTEPLMYLYFKLLDIETRIAYKNLTGTLLIMMLMLLFAFNDKRYSRIQSRLFQMYSNEDQRMKDLRLVVVVVVFLVPLMLPFVVIPFR